MARPCAPLPPGRRSSVCDTGDRYLIVNPFSHTFGYKAGILACLMTGATMVPDPVFDVARLVERVEQERITVLPGPPTIFQSILDHPDRKGFDLSSLRLVVTGAAVVPVELVRALWSDLGIETVLTAYGLTEATGTVTMCRRGDSAEVISGTSGRAIPDVEVRIVGADGTPQPAGGAGEIVVRGYNVMRGYFNEPDGSDESIDGDGWLHTGDVGAMDAGRQRHHHRPAQGHVRVRGLQRLSGRGGGRPAAPSRQSSQVAVVGVPDRRMGEVGLALVVPAGPEAGDGLDAELVAWAKQRLANYKVPQRVLPVDGLPANASGKVLNRELREEYGGAPMSRSGRTHIRAENSAENRAENTTGRGAMRGIVYTGDDVEVTDQLSVGDPGPSEVRVAIGAAGVCHSDLSVINGTIPWKAPSVLGHEGAGVVEAVGSEVRSVKPGDHVVIATLQSCGTCRACSTGHPTWCVKTLGNVSQPFTFKGEPASNFAGHLGVRRVDHHQGGPGGQDLRGRADDLGLPDRLRSADRRRGGAQPGQGEGRGDRRRLRRRGRGPQRDPGPASGRGQPDHRRRHPGLQGAAGPPVRRHPLRRRLDHRRGGGHSRDRPSRVPTG